LKLVSCKAMPTVFKVIFNPNPEWSTMRVVSQGKWSR
jgi:hypothetical protein